MATEKRLIDAGDLWSDVMMLPHNGDMISSEEVEQAIMDAQTVDAVEVVRCKDCIYYHKKLGIGFGKCSKTRIFPYGEDFCSYGERKNNG